MYWQLLIRKFDPLSADDRYVLSSIDPVTPPAVRVTEIVAEGSWQVATALEVSVNTTGTTPRLTLNTLDPSALIGCWMCAWSVSVATTNGLSVGVLA